MIVVTGGIASGKKTFLERSGVNCSAVYDAREPQASTAAFRDAMVVLHAEELVRKTELDDETIQALLSKQAVTCTEVGSGVIPLTWEDRQFRERAGALSSNLAQQAACVVRMVCGIPVTLKGELAGDGTAATSAVDGVFPAKGRDFQESDSCNL